MGGRGSRIKPSHVGQPQGGVCVSTLALTCTEDMSLPAFNEWIFELIKKIGPDLYRLKGILAFHGYDEVFVAHGVHMIFDGEKTHQTWKAKGDADGTKEGKERR